MQPLLLLPMKLWTIVFCSFLSVAGAFGQSAAEIQETARGFQRQGDYPNAINVLVKGVAQFPDNLDLSKDLAFVYYLNRQYRNALDVTDPIIKKDLADEQVYQVAGLAHRSNLDFKSAEANYKAALKKFPKSGILYADYGEMLDQKDPGFSNGLKWYEAGIAAQADYPGNYYHASKAYVTVEPLRSVLYGEIFVNMESYSARTAEIKTMLLEVYNKLWANGMVGYDAKNAFEEAVADKLRNLSTMAARGLSPERLTAIRARFNLDWFNGPAAKYPYRLFELHQQLLREGLFDAYNQWLLGSVANLPAYQAWIKTHNEEYTAFTQFQRNRVFKMPQGQHYADK
jgi:tetratricopeptide (TPR) repeat protein